MACWFGIQLSMKSIDPLMLDGKQTVIGELETLAVAVALMLWGSTMASSKLLIFIEAASITHICALASNALDSFS